MKKFGFLALILSVALVGCKPKEEASTTVTTETPGGTVTDTTTSTSEGAPAETHTP